MFDFFDIKRNKERAEEDRKRKIEFRDRVYENILQGQSFMLKIRAISRADYWKWRLPFDLERYNLK